MASSSAATQVTWRKGDSSLTPDLREATVQRLTSTSHKHETTAPEMFTDEEEEEEEAAPASKVIRQSSNDLAQEKPVFPSNAVDPRLCVPLKLSDIFEDSVPYTINRYLRDYQREGIRFIYKNYIRSRGCILGDDMGLGKTVQIIGFLAAVLQKTGTYEDIQKNRPQFLQSQMPSKQSKPNKVFLVVAPLSVLYNWKDELETWGHFQCVVVHGLRKEEELARIKKGRIEIALTTYETLRLCLDHFNNIEWSAVVVDEAHKIKNPNSKITQAMKGLTCKIRIGLTGTILQNNLEELWCVMDWAIPGCLGSIGHFKNKFSDPIEQGQRHSATKRVLATGRKAVKALVRKISHCFLRRTKALIKEQMPKKDDRVVYCSLTDFQQTVYQTVLDTEDVTLMLRSAEKCHCQSGRTRRRCCYKTNSEGVAIKELYFSYLAILRKVANHVALLQSTAGISKKQEKYVGDICAKVFQKFPDFVQRCKDEAFEALSDPMYSGKMKVLQKLLKHYLKKRDKVLLFSLSTKLLDVLESYCMAEGLDYSRLDGNTKSKERLELVKEFNSSSHINLCLVSTMAGGLGLNFVGANVVVLFDPTWNPANDLQAIDRAYRIGQCRDVTVLRLISLGTVEEVIYLRQVYKQQLQSSVMGKESARRYFEAVHGVNKGELFGIKNLFRLQTQGTCLTRKILEREGQVESGVMTARTHTGEEREEEAKGVSKSGDSPHAEDSRWNNEPEKVSTDASNVPKGVLDFSSGSEEDEEEEGAKKKKSTPLAAQSNGNESPATGPGPMSLLQHGFSRLLEGVQGKTELEEGDSSPYIEENTSEEDAEDQKRKGPSTGISTTGSGAVSLLKPATKFWDSSGSDREDRGIKDGGRQEGVSVMKQSDDAGRRSNLKITVNEDSDENVPSHRKSHTKLKTKVQKTHRFMGYSDESEDLDMETMKKPKCAPLNPHGRGENRGTGGTDRNRKRQSASARDKAKSKCRDKIETFTSSEDEHTPVKKRSTGISLTSPQTERSRVEFATERKARLHKTVTFTNLKNQTTSTSKEKGGTLDNVLGGVEEVMYTHSNQRVVGESRAEKLISRAAVRDVFERKMYSQLPANDLLDTQESLSSSPPDSPPCPSADRPEVPTVNHPVTYCNKSVHHTRHTTFIFGETPNAIRRQQLEEMVANFNFSSVHQFAAEILRSNSTQRLSWLRQFYTSLNHPDLADAVTKNFPQPDSAQCSSSTATPYTSTKKRADTKAHTDTRPPKKDVSKSKERPQHPLKNQEDKSKPDAPQNNVSGTQKKCRKKQNYVREPKEKQKMQQKNVVEPLSDFSSFEMEEQEETVCSARGHKRTKRGSVSSSGAVRAGGGLGLDRASSSGLGSGETAAFLHCTHRDTPSSPDLSHGTSSMLSKPTAQGREQDLKLSSRTCQASQGQRETPPTSSLSHHSSLTDLIGDTSILDDLLKPKSRGAQQCRVTTKTHPALSSKPSPSLSGVPCNNDCASTSPTDFLSSKTNTEPSHQAKESKRSRKDFWDILNEGNEESINRLTDPAEVQRVCINTNFAARSKSGEEESKSLWKTNDKFLWKK